MVRRVMSAAGRLSSRRTVGASGRRRRTAIRPGNGMPTGWTGRGAKAKCTYLGLAEPDTRGPGGLPSGLARLGHMGFTHVQFMPVQDFANDESRPDEYNWGYMPGHFNSPDGVYASRPGGPEKIREFKQLVAAVH